MTDFQRLYFEGLTKKIVHDFRGRRSQTKGIWWLIIQVRSDRLRPVHYLFAKLDANCSVYLDWNCRKVIRFSLAVSISKLFKIVASLQMRITMVRSWAFCMKGSYFNILNYHSQLSVKKKTWWPTNFITYFIQLVQKKKIMYWLVHSHTHLL